jgi:hypothetical protein
MQLHFLLFLILVIRYHPFSEVSEQTNIGAYVTTYQFVFRYSQYSGQYEGTNMAGVFSSVSSTYL